MHNFIRKWIVSVLTVFMFTGCRAEGISIGFVNGVTGPIGETAQELRLLTSRYIDMVNAQGGINGIKAKLVVRDDEYDPTRTPVLVEELIDKEQVIGFVNSAGTATTLAVIKSRVLNKKRVPLVGVFSGAEEARGDGSDEIFHTRPTYSDEIRKIARLSATLGQKKIAVLYQDDAFGQSILKSIAKYEIEFGLEILAKVSYKPGNRDFRKQAFALETVGAQALFLFGTPDSTYHFINAYNAPPGAAQIYTLSFVSPKRLAAVAGEAKIRGVGISQVVPNPNSATLPLVKDFQTFISSQYGKGIDPSPLALEGYLNIRLLIDAMRMTSPRPSGEDVLRALKGMRDYRLGGFKLDFYNGNRNGSEFTDIAVVGRNGRLQY